MPIQIRNLMEIFAAADFQWCNSIKIINKLITFIVAPENVSCKLSLGEVHWIDKTGIAIIDELLMKNPQNFKVIADADEKILPYIGCTVCKRFWFCYRLADNAIRTNSRSNYVNHACKAKNPLIRIDNDVKEQLPNRVRDQLIDFLAETMPKYSTIKMNSGIQLANDVANFASNLTLRTLKNFKFDATRQLVSKRILSKGKSIIEQNKEMFFANYDQSCIVIDHWSNHGYCFLAIIGRTMLEGQLCEYLLEFKEASRDKSANGVVQDISEFIVENKTPLPIISDNCSVMIAMSKYSNNIFKVFCLEHKLAIIEARLHKNEIFKKNDDHLAAINSFFNTRHGKFDLPRKPLSNFSCTRPWRSHKENYQIFCQNYDRYLEISYVESNFPFLPAKVEIEKLAAFEKQFCGNFDILELKGSSLVDGLKVYVNLIILSRDNDFKHLNLEQTVVSELYPIVFSPISTAFYFLNRINLSSNAIQI